MVQAAIASRNQSLFWNLSADVGPGQANKADDVEFVRLAYYLAKDNPKFFDDPKYEVMKPILQKITPTGAFDDNLALAIRTHQSLRGGRISVARNNDFNRGRYDRENSIRADWRIGSARLRQGIRQ